MFFGEYANGTVTYNSANSLNQNTDSGIGYDTNGDQQTGGGLTNAFDEDNRLRSVAGTSTSGAFVYDSQGRLWQTSIVSGGTTAVANGLYDGDKLIAEYDGSNNLLRRYVHESGADKPIVEYDINQGVATKTWFYANHQGSIIVTADVNGNALTNPQAYGPFGESASSIGRFGYTGQRWLGQFGLYFYKARFYAPGQGRYLQTDTWGYKADMNLYAYVGNDPINMSDPTGHKGDDDGVDPPSDNEDDELLNSVSSSPLGNNNNFTSSPSATNAALGTTSGGPGTWGLSNKFPSGPNGAYQISVTGAQAGVEYGVATDLMTNGWKWFDGYSDVTGNLIDAKNWTNWPNPDFQMSVTSATNDIRTSDAIAGSLSLTFEVVVPTQATANLLMGIIDQNGFANTIVTIKP